MKKLIYPIILLLLMSLVYGDFWEMHLRDSEIALNMPPDSFYKDLIDNREQIFHGCNAGTDATVLWYLREETQFNYQQSHARRAYERCNELAGSDEDLRVCCLGMGAHHTQDAFVSHGLKARKGFTPACIQRYWGSNILLHAACENAMTQQVLNTLSSGEAERITLAAGNAYDIFKDEDVTTEEYENQYAQLLAESFGFVSDQQKDSFFNAVFIVGDFVKTGQGSGYLRIYEQNRDIPMSWYIIPVVLIVLATILMFLSIFLGKNNWKWVSVFLLIIIILASIIFIISIINGMAFTWFRRFANFLPTIIYAFTALISVVGVFLALRFKGALRIGSIIIFLIIFGFSGYILLTTNFGVISIPEWEEQRAIGVEETNAFLSTGELLPLDASGLDFFEGSEFVQGTLTEAEKTFDFIKWILIGALLFLFAMLFVVMRQE